MGHVGQGRAMYIVLFLGEVELGIISRLMRDYIIRMRSDYVRINIELS